MRSSLSDSGIASGTAMSAQEQPEKKTKSDAEKNKNTKKESEEKEKKHSTQWKQAKTPGSSHGGKRKDIAEKHSGKEKKHKPEPKVRWMAICNGTTIQVVPTVVDLGLLQLSSTQVKTLAVCQISGLKKSMEEAFQEGRHLLYLKLKSTLMPNLSEYDARLGSFHLSNPNIEPPARTEWGNQATLFCANSVVKFVDGKQASEPMPYGVEVKEEKKS